MSTVKPIPAGYHTITPYLVVDDARRLITFLEHAFNAKSTICSQSEDGKTVHHAELKIGDSMLMVGQACGEHKANPTMLYLYVLDTDATYQQALKAGGTKLLDPVNQFYGDRNAAITDFAGNQWWIATHVEDLTPEELKKRSAKAAAEKCCADDDCH